MNAKWTLQEKFSNIFFRIFFFVFQKSSEFSTQEKLFVLKFILPVYVLLK